MTVVNTNIAETINITQNGQYDVARYTTANVNTPAAPALYREFIVSNGILTNSTSTPFLSLPNTVTDINSYCFAMCYRFTPSSILYGAIDLSSLTTISGESACSSMFNGCTGITSVDLSSLTTISGTSACSSMFINCTGITSVDLSSLTTMSSSNACTNMFSNCTGLTSVDLSSLTIISGTCQGMFSGCTGVTSVNLSSLSTISGGQACYSMFNGCTGITSVDLSSLTTISGGQACYSMFVGCTGLTSVDLSSLTTINGSNACANMFNGCTSLATVRIGNTTAIDFGTRTNQFGGMFTNCTQNIDVYAPAANQAKIESFSGYPNFGATGTVTWHWNTATE